ncbi:D-amino acid dehydrogenase small subunit [Oryzomicrobium terrae]|uniref:D-amino acid dehydrogenase n=1 Tax=Oryzomicrobium terrae TaxID=1735038 RepID=A0A5C1E611_9RHOO|nr:D-amino acid dehydrogenase [Oryzomicrobium terrae]QEL63718.1 D-amino acid dehydrogenase small subunit [Oryzomicrobium terrae]
MQVIVLGAGVVGTTSAWFLAAAGHQVTVIDRQPGAGLETSFANGGQISVCHAEPWANPHTPLKALAWMGREDSPLLFHLRADRQLIDWSLRFLRECTPGRTRRNMVDIVHLALYSRRTLQALRAELGPDFQYDHLERGILHIFTDPREFDAAIKASAAMRDLGLDRQPVSVDQCIAIEPALADVRHRLVGGDWTPSDESGDAHKFTQALAARAAARGVQFRYGTTIEQIPTAGGQVAGVVVRGPDGAPELLTADAYVLSLGSYSPLMARPLGLHLPIYPAKGYSATLPIKAGSEAHAPTVSLTDDERKLVFSRLGNRLRVAGTAEFGGYGLELNPVRCEALLSRTKEFFPHLELDGPPQYWTGLRPATPSNVPIIGRSTLPNLWLNTGHGTLGWTMSCGSAAALADLVSGKTPEPVFPFLGRPRP